MIAYYSVVLWAQCRRRARDALVGETNPDRSGAGKAERLLKTENSGNEAKKSLKTKDLSFLNACKKVICCANRPHSAPQTAENLLVLAKSKLNSLLSGPERERLNVGYVDFQFDAAPVCRQPADNASRTPLLTICRLSVWGQPRGFDNRGHPA
jgi:hypothetical protein